MPRSRRSKVVTLSQTDKKGHEGKAMLYTGIQESLDKFDYMWVFDVANMRNTYLKRVRDDWKDSRIYMGKTKVMGKALGYTAEEEHAENVSKLSKLLHGTVGLLFTNNKPEDVTGYFESFVQNDFARAGTVAPFTHIIPAGPVYSRGGQIPVEDDVPLAHTLEPQVRQLGMPTMLKNGVVTLLADFTLCTEGQELDSRQTRLLKLFGVTAAEFKVKLLGVYTKKNASVQLFETEQDAGNSKDDPMQ
ncbi:ribosome assembly protein [Schizosaccharomyces cryophilus OY26]|uniref:Ribosome assembly factor mrt4 n=1 Tax=Schizosaccharomyces cryophilus (strain OY26 / ATCC MYA-4695 / CBS 11777 / NBRC 106824 / NRRL Y48691) TaxID=653667 RepID=S9XGZ8_SCHCR|nr:ribosome assembly protein [Schizosaccharomyces cryophilus OY26]EPY52946.1 ribosome assembly protein [Schizosaccharomyces cryophilus OY26]